MEHNIPAWVLHRGLVRCDILINKKALVDLAVFEPRTFKSLVDIAWARMKTDGLNVIKHLDFPASVVREGMIKPPRFVPRGQYNPNAGIVTRHMIE